MKQINLLPARLLDASLRRGLAGALLGAALLACLLLGAAVLTVRRDAAVLSDTLRRREQAEAARIAQAGANGEGAALAAAGERVAQFNALAKNEVDWSRAFAVVGDIVPRDIRLSSYSYATASGSVQLKMAGEAPSNHSFAIFVASLKESALVKGVKVDSFQYDPSKGTVAFTVSCQVIQNKVDYGTGE